MSKCPAVGSLVVGDGMDNILRGYPLERLCGIVTRVSRWGSQEKSPVFVHVYWLDTGVREFGNGINGGYYPERFNLVANQPLPLPPEALSQLGKDEFTDSMILAIIGITTTREED